jgi:hypothetical protein
MLQNSSLASIGKKATQANNSMRTSNHEVERSKITSRTGKFNSGYSPDIAKTNQEIGGIVHKTTAAIPFSVSREAGKDHSTANPSNGTQANYSPLARWLSETVDEQPWIPIGTASPMEERAVPKVAVLDGVPEKPSSRKPRL